MDQSDAVLEYEGSEFVDLFFPGPQKLHLSLYNSMVDAQKTAPGTRKGQKVKEANDAVFINPQNAVTRNEKMDIPKVETTSVGGKRSLNSQFTEVDLKDDVEEINRKLKNQDQAAVLQRRD